MTEYDCKPESPRRLESRASLRSSPVAAVLASSCVPEPAIPFDFPKDSQGSSFDVRERAAFTHSHPAAPRPPQPWHFTPFSAPLARWWCATSGAPARACQCLRVRPRASGPSTELYCGSWTGRQFGLQLISSPDRTPRMPPQRCRPVVFRPLLAVGPGDVDDTPLYRYVRWDWI